MILEESDLIALLTIGEFEYVGKVTTIAPTSNFPQSKIFS